MKVAHNIFVDFGNTNIKVLYPNNEIKIYSNKIAFELFSELTNEYENIFVFNTNLNIEQNLELSNFENIKFISKQILFDDNLINNDIDFSKVGFDILLLGFFAIKMNNFKEAIIVNSGTFLTTVVIKNFKISNVFISLGNILEQKELNKIFNIYENEDYFKTYDYDFKINTTEKAIKYSYPLKILGNIIFCKNKYNIKKNIYVTGNYFKNFDVKLLEFNKIKYIENICLKAFKQKIEKK